MGPDRATGTVDVAGVVANFIEGGNPRQQSYLFRAGAVPDLHEVLTGRFG